KIGQGTLTLNGASANTYTGLTAVSGGLLQLDKGDATGPQIAIPGNLQINGLTEVRLLRAEQIADNKTVTLAVQVTNDTVFNPFLNLNGFSETIGPLNMTGGYVAPGSGFANGSAGSPVLTLNGDVTAQSDGVAPLIGTSLG